MDAMPSATTCRCGTCAYCRAARTDARRANIVQPDLELVAVPRDESFKVWSHGYPYRTVRWHFHPEYEIQVITSTTGKYFVGDYIGNFAPGNLVMTGTNLPHNWVSNVSPGERVDERCLILQFDAEVVANAIKVFPELKCVESLLDASRWGVLFTPKTGAAAEPIMREMLGAQGMRRITLFLELLDLLVHSTEQVKLASAAYRADPTRMPRRASIMCFLILARTCRKSCAKRSWPNSRDKAPAPFRDISAGIPVCRSCST
jgi:hypothetical protein